MKIYTYRYCYRTAPGDEVGPGDLKAMYFTGSDEEHASLISRLKSDDTILHCCREYVLEFDSALSYSLDTIVDRDKTRAILDNGGDDCEEIS
ncbi:hypothetical protein [Dipodfec virus UA23Rod_1125]|uniref:Uncharacterized protein n=1 Tax=Dipodfec virus UA23Rod_1125 TaxID=2929328 RepID=A0A976R8Q5_9VIRU|nr:hypothetical protein [Dipodfec virus UA23Rod_1125]